MEAWHIRAMALTMKKEPKISVSCKCGKVLHVPLQYAGKRGRCPQCARLLTVPHPESMSVQISENVCPTCGAYLNADDEVCVACRTNLKTGEWEAIGGKRRIVSRIMRRSLAPIYLLVSLGVILYLALIPSGTNNRERSEFQRIRELRDENADEIAQKLQELQNFEESYLPETFRKSRQMSEDLRERQQESQILERCAAIKEQSRHHCLREWLEMELLVQKFPAARHQKLLEPEIRRAQDKVVQSFRSCAGELGQLIQEKRLAEIVTRTTPQLMEGICEIFEVLSPASEVSSCWTSVLRLYREIPGEQKPVSQQQSIYEQIQLEYYRKQYQRYHQQFEQWMYMREYDLAQQELENLWEALHSLGNIDQDDSLVGAIRTNLKEVQSVKALFSIAYEGAKGSAGTNMKFSLKNGEQSGIVLQYALGYFTIQTQQDKKVQIPLKKLQAQDIVALALNKKENKDIHQYAGIFYLYERQIDLSKQSFYRALEGGADTREIQEYLQKIQQEQNRVSSKPSK